MECFPSPAENCDTKQNIIRGGGQVISPVSPVTSEISPARQGGAKASKLAACIHSNVL